MIHRSLLHYAAITVLAMALVVSPALAVPAPLELPSATEAQTWLSPVWNFLSSLLSGGETVQPGEGLDTRCTIDPNGQPLCVETDPPNG